MSTPPFSVSWLWDSTPDPIALAIVLLLTFFLLCGPKTSVIFNAVITVMNLLILAFIIVVMLVKSSPETFAEPARGGFTPYSFIGVLSAASTCFYAYIGFDGLSICCEEAKDPKKSMPISLSASVIFVALLLVLSSLALSLYVPWYTVDRGSAFTVAFQVRSHSPSCVDET